VAQRHSLDQRIDMQAEAASNQGILFKSIDMVAHDQTLPKLLRLRSLFFQKFCVYNEIMTTLLFTILISAAFSAELVGSGGASAAKPAQAINYAAIELGGCKPQEDLKTKSEEGFAKAEAEKNDLPKEEMLARLIYSESLSTGYWHGHCEAPSVKSVMKGIGWGVMKRVTAKAKSQLDPYKEAIFAPKQFRTSFSGKKENAFAEAFLCPLKSDSYLDKSTINIGAAALYKQAQDIAKEIIVNYEKSGLPTEYKKITNFFYPKSEFFGEMRPAWAKDKDPSKNKGYKNILEVKQNPCIEFYEL
jgi:hypothetical protein